MSSPIIMRYAFKSGSRYLGVLGFPGLGEVGVLHSDDGCCLRFCSTCKKGATNRNLLWQKPYCLHLQEQEREWQNPVPFKENYPPPRTCRSLIGCSPLAEAHWPSYRHGRHLVTANVRAAPHTYMHTK
jgi:hypothetical protein